MQTNEEVMHHILDILKTLVPEGLEITTETDLIADLGLDSLKIMRILESLEDTFDISIPLNILPDVRTISDLAFQIEKLNKK